MDIKRIINSLHPLERKVLPVLDKVSSFKEIVNKTGLQEVEVMRALQWMQNKKILVLHQELKEIINLDENGKKYRDSGLPEKKFLQSLDKELTLPKISEKTKLRGDEINISIGILKQKGAIDIKKGKETIIKITNQGKNILNKKFLEEYFLKKDFPLNIKDLKQEEKLALENLRRRKKIIKIDVIKEKTPQLTELGKSILKAGMKFQDVLDRVTSSMLKDNSWRNKTFRSYDVQINVPQISGGKRHFVNQAINYIKRIWLDLGFKEMTGNVTQTSFWDLDSLFVPQDHPSRDMQDTFYIKDPKQGKLPKELMEKVKATHEDGWTTNSKGWQYKWSVEEAKKLLLITHDTYLSAKTLSKLKKEDLPIKTFQIMKVFRNEALSWKSLFEFYQIGGIVVDPDANFMNLKGYLKDFFAKMGFSNIRIRPGHFPYTEPSAEVDVWHLEKKDWVEVAGSGIFRPEVVKPLLGFECPVLAWGIGLERSIMEYYNLKDIRDVYKNDLKQLREMKLWMK
jgi:phenylalanyl-tRNA synthetase alpha chain|tara:strand:+ start:486 stop:2015 length:1530 start_codon:yes stop_codon:yes gene_type:complete